MSKRYSTDPKIQALIESKLKSGSRIRNGKKHDVLILPNKHTLGIPSTPSDRFAYYSFLTTLKKLENKPIQNKELVVNWHITEACNYACDYCFAKWTKQGKAEILHDENKVKMLLDELFRLPEIFAKQQFNGIRLNLVGGETFLYKKQVLFIMQQAKLRGFQLSAITNGSTLDDDLMHFIAQNCTSLGFSVDSLNAETNFKIGRHQKGKLMTADKMAEKIHYLHQLNPNLAIKINTVVNELNYQELFHDWLQNLPVDKWKVFKMLPIINQNLHINDEQFQLFIKNHHAFQNIMFSENNDEMTQSYLMIDPLGRLFSNQAGQQGYQYSRPILECGIQAALNEVVFDTQKFKKRYEIKKID